MEEQVNKLIEKIENDTLSHYDFNQVLDMLKDLLVSNKVFEVGQIIKVTTSLYGHQFDLGEIIEIKDYEPTQTTSWLCSNGKSNWWLSEDEAIVI